MRVTERRFSAAKVRSAGPASPNSPGTLTGYASVAFALSEDLGGFRERVATGAFKRSLASGQDVKALINHDPNLVIGRRANGTLRLAEDPIGLRTEIDVADTSYGRDIVASVQRGDVSQMSFAFQVEDEDWSDEDDPDTGERIKVRTLRSVKLLDTAIVTYPAYAATSVSISSVDPAVQALGRSHSYGQMFPQGVPAEVRSRLGAAALNPRAQEARRRLFNLFVS